MNRRNHDIDHKKTRALGKGILALRHQYPLPPPVSAVPSPAEVQSAGHGSKGHYRSGDRESTVLRECLHYLHNQGIFAWRNNTGTVWMGGQPVSFGYPGSSDIVGILPGGKFLAVECKSATGKQSDKQKAFQEKVTAAGGLYLLVRSVEDLERGIA
jgi:hypothetical protein